MVAMDDAARFAAREAIADVVATWCAARDLAEVERVFESHKVCWGLYRTLSDLLANDPRVSLANPVFEQLTTPGVGSHRAAGTAVRLADRERSATVSTSMSPYRSRYPSRRYQSQIFSKA